jgi:hypothetical protein
MGEQAFRSALAGETQFNVPGVLVGNPDLVPETDHTARQCRYRGSVIVSGLVLIDFA